MPRLPYVVAIFDTVTDWNEIQCMALAAAWSPLAGGRRLHDADASPVRSQSRGAAFSFVMKCAIAGISFRGPTLDDAA
jgi:hypothetical protein